MSLEPATLIEPLSPRHAAREAVGCAVMALERLRDSLDEAFDETVRRLVSLQGKVLTLGVGKSGHAAQKVAATLRSVGIPAMYMNASDSLHGDLGVIGGGDLAREESVPYEEVGHDPVDDAGREPGRKALLTNSPEEVQRDTVQSKSERPDQCEDHPMSAHQVIKHITDSDSQ